MKYLIILVLGIVLIGCEKITEESTHQYILPDELSDCKIYRLQSDNGQVLYITRCDDIIATSSKQGKTQIDVITINGEKYQKVEQ